MVSRRRPVDVLLTDGWLRSTYAALVNLSGHGLRVAVSDESRIGMCQFSRYRRGRFRYPSPFRSEERFVGALARFAAEHGVRVLLPSHDETEVIARHRERFPADLRIPVASLEQLSVANDKSRIQEIAAGCGVRTPERLTYTAIDDLRATLAARAEQPLVVRLRRGNSAKGVFYPRSNAEVVRVVEELVQRYGLAADRLPVVQEYVHGEGWGVSCLYWHGERIVHFTHRRLREKTASGGTSTLRDHHPNPVIEAMAFTVLDHLRWHGLAMVEFKHDPRTGQAWLIEINPRLWGSIHLAVSAGVEFPYVTYLCATAGPEAARRYQQSRTVRYPWRARWYLGDCIGAVGRLGRGRVGPALRLLAPGGTDTYDDVSSRDPLAFVGEVLRYGLGFVRTGSLNPAGEGMLG